MSEKNLVGDKMKDKPVHLEEDHEFIINGYSHQGEGIGRIDNFTVFVPGAILGERARVKITEIKKNFARGQLEEIILSSPFRVGPRCSVYNFCGGCQLQHIVYEKQLEIKKVMVQDALMRLGHQKVEVLPVIGMEYPWRYRNKGHFQVEQEKGKLHLGFYRAGSYDFIPASGCVLFSSQINKLVSYLEESLSLQKVVVYNRRTGKGNLRNILIRESRDNREIMMVFITKEESLGFDQSILNNITRIFPQVVSIYQNINKGYRSVLWGKDFRLLKGKVDLEDAIGPFRFKISPQSFFQVNVAQAQILNEKILEYSHLSGEETVIDSYCGTAAISIYLANYAKKVYGIEIEKSAIRDAKINSELNQSFNLKFFTGRVEEWLYRWRKRGEKAQIIILDPPRKGCSLKTLKEMVKIEPEKILYVSCNPATLARDLEYLAQDDYKLEKVLPIDMFPQTSHLECIVSLKSD